MCVWLQFLTGRLCVSADLAAERKEYIGQPHKHTHKHTWGTYGPVKNVPHIAYKYLETFLEENMTLKIMPSQ